MLEAFRGATALVTGASAGLGAEFARQLAPIARRLILVARRLDRLDQLASELTAAHPALQVESWQVNLESEEQLEGLAMRLGIEAPEIRILINNAGLGDYGSFEGCDWKRVHDMLRVNVEALTRLTHAVLPLMIRRQAGYILNVSSIASLVPIPTFAVYAATKAYVTSFSEAVAMEVKQFGIRVTTLCPGPIPTEFTQVAERRNGNGAHKNQSPPIFRVEPAPAIRAALEALAKGKPRIIPGIIPRVAMTLASALPLPIQRAILSARV